MKAFKYKINGDIRTVYATQFFHAVQLVKSSFPDIGSKKVSEIFNIK